MSRYTYFPLSEIETVGYDDLLDLLDDDDLLNSVGILCFQRDEAWSNRPFYYVLARDDLFQAKTAAWSGIRELPRDDLFGLLNIHENTEAEKVPLGLEPARRAVAFDAGGSLAGVWIEDQAVPTPTLGREVEGGAGTGDSDRGMFPLGPDGGELERPTAENGESQDADAPAVGDAVRRSDEEPPKDPFFRRTPHMDISADEPLQLGQSFQALVYLDRSGARPGEGVREVLIADLPDDLETLDIELMLVGSEHFEVTSESIKTLVVHRDDERSGDVPFDVRVRDDAPLDIAPSLTAYLTYNHRPSGLVQRAVTIAGATLEVPADDEPDPVAADQFATDANALPADLTVDVVATPAKDGRTFLVTVRTTLVEDFAMTEPEPWNFPEQTDELVTAMMSEFAREGASPEDRQASLIGAGHQLWDLAPSSFKDLFCRLIQESNPPRTIYIASAEPHIPWELMRPTCVLADGTKQEREPLGVEFMIGRFVHPEHASPKQNDSVDASYVLAGTKYRRQKKLAKAADEATWVAARFGGTIVTPAQRTELDKMLAAQPVGLLHFVAHGKSAPNAPQQLVLDDDKVFNSLQVAAMKGLKAACEKQAPIIFINACDVGRQAPSLVGAGGFATEFIKVGARCVVAPLWSVDDAVAHDVALEFYEAALDDPLRPFADILREIRAKSFVEGGAEDTYAAYCFYGDPLTSLAPPG